LDEVTGHKIIFNSLAPSKKMMEDLPRDSLCDLFKEPIGVGILPMSLFPPASNYIQQTAGKIRSARMYFANRQKISYQDVAPVGGSAFIVGIEPAT
jgi:hypothetical protein